MDDPGYFPVSLDLVFQKFVDCLAPLRVLRLDAHTPSAFGGLVSISDLRGKPLHFGHAGQSLAVPQDGRVEIPRPKQVRQLLKFWPNIPVEFDRASTLVKTEMVLDSIRHDAGSGDRR